MNSDHKGFSLTDVGKAARLAASACLVLLWHVSSGGAQARTGPALGPDARAEVAAALYAASATQAAAQRAADATVRTLRAEIERLQSEGRRQTAALAEAQERFVDALAARDRAYAEEIRVFRDAVQDIAATPEGVIALARFNAGDEPGALGILDRCVLDAMPPASGVRTLKAQRKGVASPRWRWRRSSRGS
jgi:hypothetical protein